MHSIPLGPSEKIPFVQKHKEGAICAILREKPHFGAFPEAKKGVVNYARLRKAAHWPNNNANPSRLSKKSLLCRKARYVRSLGKKPNFWPSQRLKKLTGTLSCMHKGPKCIQSLWDHPKNIPFVQKHKEGALCAIIREKNPFWGIPRGYKGVVNYARLRKAAHWPNNNANSSGLSEKKFIV